MAGSSSASGRSTIPARTSGLKHRPTTAAARATFRASSDRPPEPGEDRVADRVRHPGVADPATVGPRVVVERAEQLLDVEGDAVRPLVDGLDDVARRRQLAAEDQRRRDRRLLERQRLEASLPGMALAEHAGTPLAMERIGRELVGAVSRDQEQRSLVRVAGELADDLEAHLVGPMEVVEDEHRRPVDRLEDPIGGGPDEQPPRAEGVAVVRPVHREQVRTERAEGRVLAHAVRHLADRREGDLAVLGCDAPAVDADARRLGLAGRRPDEPRLAQPGRAGQEQRVTAALDGLGDQLVDELEQVVTTDDDGTEHGSDATHARECTQRASRCHRSNDR